jgi:molybdate transport system ATP-binding protein
VKLSVAFRLDLGTFDLRVAFEAPPGITALFGPSGAGKTLTLRSIAGLASPAEGRILLSERLLFDASLGVDLPPRERRVGYVFQQYALFPHLSVEQNIAFGLQALPKVDRAVRVADLLELIGLEGLEHRGPAQLSGGQQQRVALARALAPGPDLLLLDEPFAAVDRRVRRRLRLELRRIHEATATPMLLVTHDLADVRQLADTLIVLDRGRLVSAGPTAALLASDDEVLAELFDDG